MTRKRIKTFIKKWPALFNGYRFAYNVFGKNHIKGGVTIK